MQYWKANKANQANELWMMCRRVRVGLKDHVMEIQRLVPLVTGFAAMGVVVSLLEAGVTYVRYRCNDIENNQLLYFSSLCLLLFFPWRIYVYHMCFVPRDPETLMP